MHFIQARILRRGVFLKSRQPPDLQYKGKKEAHFTINPKIYLDFQKIYKTIVYSRLID